MAKNNILLTDDTAVFETMIGNAKVILLEPQNLTMKGSGKAAMSDKEVCLEGDENNIFSNCTYTNPTNGFGVSGIGELRIKVLNNDQKAKKASINGKAVLLEGTKFDVLLTVSGKAKTDITASGVPDPNSTYEGKGSFKLNDLRCTAE